MIIDKFLWFCSLWPFLLIIKKIKLKKDLTAFDIFIFFNTVYFAFVPFISDTDYFGYGIPNVYYKIQTSNTISCMLFYNVFIFFLSLLSLLWDKFWGRRYSIVNISLFLRGWYRKFEIRNRVLYLWWLLLIFEFYFRFISGEYHLEMINTDMLTQEAKQYLIFLTNISQPLRIILSIYLSVYLMKKRSFGKFGKIDYVTILVFLLFIMTVPRTFQVEMLLSCILVFYAVNKEHILKKHYYKLFLISIALYFIVFPIFFFYRSSVEYYTREINQSSYSILNIDAVDYVIAHNVKIEDNKDSRPTYLYTIFAKSFDYDKCGMGKYTSVALLYGLPAVIYPKKPQYGTEELFQNSLSNGIDTADSLLLFSNMDYGSFLGPVFASLIFTLLMSFWSKYHRLISLYFSNGLVDLFFVYQIITYSDRIETSPDDYVARIVQSLLTILFFYLVYILNKKVFRVKI